MPSRFRYTHGEGPEGFCKSFILCMERALGGLLEDIFWSRAGITVARKWSSRQKLCMIFSSRISRELFALQLMLSSIIYLDVSWVWSSPAVSHEYMLTFGVLKRTYTEYVPLPCPLQRNMDRRGQGLHVTCRVWEADAWPAEVMQKRPQPSQLEATWGRINSSLPAQCQKPWVLFWNPILCFITE